jgi:hypothetical protein
MADLLDLTPNYTKSRKLLNYLRQRQATTGRVPSRNELYDIINADVEAQANQAMNQSRLNLEREKMASDQSYRTLQQSNWEREFANRQDSGDWNKYASLASPVAQLGMLDYLKTPKGETSAIGSMFGWGIDKGKDLLDLLGGDSASSAVASPAGNFVEEAATNYLPDVASGAADWLDDLLKLKDLF